MLCISGKQSNKWCALNTKYYAYVICHPRALKTRGSSRSISACGKWSLLSQLPVHSFCNICKPLALPSMQAIARMANFPQWLLPVALLPIVIATFITAEQSWQSGANLEHHIPSAPGLATTKDQAGLSSSLAGTMEISASHTAPSVDVVGTQVVREPSYHEQEFHPGGLKWVDSSNGQRFTMMGLEDADDEGQRSQEKTAGNVSTDGESVLVVTINITGFMTPTDGPNRMDALQTESTSGDYEATTSEARKQTVFCLGGTQRWTGLLRTFLNSIAWQPCCSLVRLVFLSIKIGFCCAYLFVMSSVILLCICTAFPSELPNKLIQNYFLPAIIGMLVYLLGVLVLYAILPVVGMSLIVVYRSITNWFPKMRLTSEETIARCTVELPMKVLSLALAQLMKKGTTPSQFVNPQYQHQHLHSNFRRNRRCG
ncbi:uncharacterized protein LOC144902644 [Branchiostoma floridae x Branchiostoma belcheri]